MAHNPDDTSMKNLVHFAQMISSKKMRQYDYGFIGNYLRYKQVKIFIFLTAHFPIKWILTFQFSPPEYDLAGLNVSTVAFWSPQDAMADEKDVGLLIAKLQRILVYRIEGFSHVDFLWSGQAATRIYAKILEVLEEAKDCKS